MVIKGDLCTRAYLCAYGLRDVARKRSPIFKTTGTSKKNITMRTHLSTSPRLALIDEEPSVCHTWSAATAPVHSQWDSGYSSEEKSNVTQTAG